jgi:excisionase family DNA binding protein
MADEPDVYTVEEAAAKLRIGRSAGYEAVRRGDLPAVRIGRSWRIPRHALEQKLTAAGTASPQTNGAGDQPAPGRSPNVNGLEKRT